ncbi:ATP-binding protein [Paractinoplanes rishiriensis]|uniref:Bacterial transcriptional activator domain-containing protein n=1 Tax=Paractinoplanes rishiriensis TaxID=1050105 RepID=A0A919MZT5_9ACTN|nr:BTAD domain-containing putative transcriptional regulator [Actinoplanes rishiriensis]GIE98735.1 hypothetical protein Ari01nite_62000 [Actinoplanes rishiriensis]
MTPDLVLLSGVSYRGRDIPGARLQGLLALLAADLRTGCGTGRLVDGLWPDEQPENPAKALQILVSRARSQLGGDVIARTPTGYRLTLADDRVDSAAVLDRAAAAARCERAGDHAAALAHADAGLALYPGSPLPEHTTTGLRWRSEGAARARHENSPALELHGRPALELHGGPALELHGGPVGALRSARQVTHRALVRSRALALARLTRHGEALDLLTTLADASPRDEEILAELLRCEAATLGPATALGRYETYRRRLRAELGADPGAALQAEHRRLLSGVVRHGVTAEPNQLLGRDDDVAAVEALLRTARVTSIVGPGGLGKTRLANAVARRADFPVVVVVPLAGLAGDGVGDDGVGDDGVGDDGVGPEVAELVGDGPALLVLDNCEHVVATAARLVRDLVAAKPGLRVLTTSRTPLGLSSESLYQLPELRPGAAAELFGQRARAARPGVDLPAGEVAALCRRLDGLPLAVELAAARVRTMSVAEVARRLDDRFALLRGGARDSPERHHTLHAVVDWSWNLLDPAGRAAMRALAVFPDGFTAAAAGEVLGGDPLVVLEHLAGHSLLKVDDTPAGVRLRMLETVREFSARDAGHDAGRDAGDVTAAFLRWARGFGLAHHAALLGRDPYEAAATIHAEQENLHHALRLALGRDDRPTVAAVAAVLFGIGTVESSFARVTALIGQIDRPLSHYRPAPDLVEATRTALTMAAVCTYSIEGARPMRAVVGLRRLGLAAPDTPVRAVGWVIDAAADPDALARLCDSAEPLLAAVANLYASYRGETSHRNAASARRAVDLFAELDLPWLHALGHGRAAEICLPLGQGARAREHLLAALPILQRLGARTDAVGTRSWLVLASLQTGDTGEAEQWLDGLARIAHDEQLEVTTAGYDLGIRAEVLFARGEVDEGLRLWRQVAAGVGSGGVGSGGVGSGGDRWAAEARAVTVVAHAGHGRLDLVADVVATLPAQLALLLDDPSAPRAVCGTLLLAIGLAEPGPTAGRMVALAERFGILRNFQPTMAGAGGGPADKEPAGEHPEALRAAARDLLAERQPVRSAL